MAAAAVVVVMMMVMMIMMMMMTTTTTTTTTTATYDLGVRCRDMLLRRGVLQEAKGRAAGSEGACCRKLV
jgi:hypothetical protein